jgi:hypothetical protein
MNKLILHHIYANGLAFDVSQNGNHGFPILVVPSTGPFLSTFAFNQWGSRINVRPSASLQNLFSIRAIVRFYLSPRGQLHRFNLMEGHLSYALFVNPDASLQGTILDTNSAWNGATSGPGVVTSNAWHVAELRHDGVSNLQLFLDGNVVAQTYNVVGPVRSVADEGIAIGHWPGGSGVYTFEGILARLIYGNTIRGMTSEICSILVVSTEKRSTKHICRQNSKAGLATRFARRCMTCWVPYRTLQQRFGPVVLRNPLSKRTSVQR